MSTNARDMPRREGQFEREPARRVFAAELRECRYQFKEGEDEKSPTFVLLPSGERSNRIFIVGTLTEKTRQGEQNMFYRGRVVDPT
ncbi:MAG: nucleic acid-binding protein, partial [Methanoregula sp.]|nr:nucleic acid-binding protein [Methanoregula sp.]